MQARLGTHGDHSVIALTPLYPREIYLETMRAFHLAELDRTPVYLMLDEIMAHTTESFDIPRDDECGPVKPRSEYEEAREDTFWLLRMLDEDDWQRAGIHPYRGRITVTDIAREMHEHDLEYLYEAQRLRKSLADRASR